MIEREIGGPEYRAAIAEARDRNRRTHREEVAGRVLLYVLAAFILIVALASAGQR